MISKLANFCFLSLSFLAWSLPGQQANRHIPFELDANRSATYAETIAFYEALAADHPQLQLLTMGATDSGYPLHYAVLSNDEDFSPASLRRKGRHILFVNNGIHAGEPCGVDASMLLLRDYLTDPARQEFLDRVVLVVIPFYNISGALNRGAYSRANQNGPSEHGFRANARNLDLNRDFIKADARNTRTFHRLFTLWQPDVFVDTHTSNGADYQYTLTLIASQHNKLDPALADYQQKTLLPSLYAGMATRGWEMTPYVSVRGTPDEGIAGFLDLPRYSSGYAALHNALSFITEAHMLKPYADRVQSTYAFLDLLVRTMYDQTEELRLARALAVTHTIGRDSFDLNWRLDPSRADTLQFKGYSAAYKTSEVSGLERLYYDRAAPYTKPVPYYNYYESTVKVVAPDAYLVPQAYPEVIERLQLNSVRMERLESDTTLLVEMYYIRDFETTDYPYEGHYLHSQVEVEKEIMEWAFRAGDVLVHTDQPANRFIVETLEPQGADSWFAWNFFDGILMQKEYFSSYVFEDLAARYLRDDPELRRALEARKAEDEEFARSARAQLNFIYRRSPHYERSHQLYPVARLVKERE